MTRDSEDESSRLRSRLERERTARKDAEQISERAIRRLYEKQAEVELLQIVATASNEASTVDEAMEVAVGQVCSHTGWPVGHAYLLERGSTPELVPTTIWHLKEPARFDAFRKATEATRFSSGVGLPGRVLAAGVPIWIIDVTNDLNFPRADAAREVGLKAAFGFPVHANAHVVAVLEFFAHEAAEPDDALLSLMAHIGTQLGRVVERERAREQHRRFQGILDNAPAVIFARNLEGRFLFVNRQFERSFHIKAEEVAGKTLYDIVPADTADALMASDQKVLQDGGPREFEHVIPHGDEIRSYLSVKFPLRDATGVPSAVCGISVDITERRQIERELAAKEEEDRAHRERSNFLSRVSHELRTPLNAILGFAQLLELEELESSQQKKVQQITKGGRHLLELINEVLEISRIDAGTMKISLEPVSINRVVEEVLELMQPLAARQMVTFEIKPEADAPTYVMADNQRLKQVLLNLVSNAVKYNREGGSVVIRVERPRSDRCLILVKDSGKGIPELALTKIFTPFERLDADRSKIEGTGLGLTLSKLLVEAMGGSLAVESEPWVGSTFMVGLTAASKPAVDVGADLPSPVSRADAASSQATVLYIEDNISNFELVEEVLAHRPNVSLLAAANGSLGLELAREHAPDLILLDLHLPEMSGERVLGDLKDDPRTRDIPVVVVSADATEKQIRQLIGAGAHAYLTKPISVKPLLEAVDNVIEIRSGEPARV